MLVALITACTREAPSAATTLPTASAASTAPDATSDPGETMATPSPTSAATLEPEPDTTPQPTTGTADTTASIIVTSTTAAPTTVPQPTAAATCVDRLSLRERAALLVWPGILAAEWDTAVEVVTETGVGGVLVMNTDGFDAAEFAERLGDLRASARVGLIVATDEEGGAVQRLAEYRPLESQLEVSTDLAPAEASELIASHGRFVRSLGIDMVFGPVIDVLPAEGDPPLDRSRFFTGDADNVAAFGLAYVEGWSSAGVTPVVKHFPGHGSASGDTHDVQGLTPPLTELAARDLVPFARLAVDRPAVMVGHLTVPGLTDGEPASRSPAAVDYLRTTLGYGDALVVSDGLGMAAVGRSVPDAAVESIAAGIDVALFTDTSQTGAVIDAIVAAVDDGRLAPDRVSEAAIRVVTAIGPADDAC